MNTNQEVVSLSKTEFTIRPIEAKEVDFVADLLSTEYYDDDFFIWSVPDDSHRFSIVSDYYKVYLRSVGCVAHVAENDKKEIVGAAVWLPHDASEDMYDEIDQVVGIYAPQFRAVADNSHLSEPNMEPFYQLVGFGVLHSLRGLGIGGALLNYHLEILDKKGIPTYLEASTPYFGGGVYGRFGYQPVGELMVFAEKAVLYPLWRAVGKQSNPPINGTEPKKHPTQGRSLDEDISVASISSTLSTLSSNYEVVHFGDYSWYVLESSENRMLLLSEKIIDCSSYHHTFEEITWKDAGAREFLNTTFFQSFSAEEQARILETTVPNPPNPWFGTKATDEMGEMGNTGDTVDTGNAGNAEVRLDTCDRIFLLSLDEVINYMGDSKQGIAQKELFYLDDSFNSLRKAVALDNTPTRWTLRTAGNLPYLVVTVTIDGRVSVSGDFVNRPSTELFQVGLRPAMWVRKR